MLGWHSVLRLEDFAQTTPSALMLAGSTLVLLGNFSTHAYYSIARTQTASGKPSVKAEPGFKAFAATNPEVDVRPKRIRVRTVTLYCEDNSIVYKAASLNELFAYINDSGPKTSFGAAGNSIEFEVKSGYL